MNVCALVVLLLVWKSDNVSSKDIRDMNVQELIQLAEDLSQVRPNDVKEDDITFYLSTREESNKEIIPLDQQVPNKPGTKVLIHGWLESHNRTWYQKMTDEYLENGDFNVIQVDWHRVARSSYISSSQNCKLVGESVAALILTQNISLDNLHLIGHSLGAHVAAFSSKKIKRETGRVVHRITGLDPAGPSFKEVFITPDQRLNNKDATIVDAIHTDAGVYGYEKPIGTLDIYVNGGTRVQPGCLPNIRFVRIGEFIEESFCSHAKSCDYFIDLINRKRFTCTKCRSWETYQEGLCKNNESYVFGSEDIDDQMTGVCYVKTSSVKLPSFFYNLFENM